MQTTVTIRDGQGYVTDLPDELLKPLKKACSFRPSGYQFTAAFRRGKGDGRIHLFNHSKFPAGLLDTIIGVFQVNKCPFDLVIEQSPAEKPLLPMDVVDIDQRDYQDDAVERAMLHPRGVIRSPTGSGKTAIGCRIIAGRQRWALVVVPTIDLLKQYREFLEMHLVIGGQQAEIGQLGDGVVDPKPVTVATVRTAAKAMDVAYKKPEFAEYDDSDNTEVDRSSLREWLDSIGTLIVDEAHILGADAVYGVATKLTAFYKYGMSASPWRDDGADLMITAATGGQIFRIGTKELVDQGYLVPPVIRVINTVGWWTPAAWGQICMKCKQQRQMTSKGPARVCSNCNSKNWRSQFQEAYKQEIVDNPIRNAMLAREANRLPGPTLLLVKHIAHGKLLQTMIPGSVFLSGKDSGDDRKIVFDKVRGGDTGVVIASTIADLGLDIPSIRTLILGGGGRSSTRHLQRIGRAVRPYKGKSSALVIDVDDSHVHRWFREQARLRRKIERDEWGGTAIWL